MKIVAVLFLVAFLGSAAASGQGQFIFFNKFPPQVNARFVLCTDPPGTSSLMGDQYHVQVLAGRAPLASDPSQALASWIFDFGTGAEAGYVYSPTALSVPGMQDGEVATILVRAYQGNSWEASPVRYEGIFVVRLDYPPGTPWDIPLGTMPLVLCEPGSPPDDGLDRWTWHGTVSSDLAGVAYGNGCFVAVGNYSEHAGILVSRDGHHWTHAQSPSTNDLRRIGFGDGLFVAVGNAGTILASSNGLSWFQQQSGVTNDLAAVGYGAGEFLVAGDAGTVLGSPDGSHWDQRNPVLSVPLPFASVAYGNGTYFVASTSGGVSSGDGRSWHKTDVYAADMVFANGLFVAVEAYGIWNFTNAVYVGTFSGVEEWSTPGNSTDLNLLWSGAALRGVTYGHGRFVTVSDHGGLTASSADGTNWLTSKAPTDSGLYAVAYGNGLFIAVGEQGAILSSTDGQIWNREGDGNSGWFVSAAYGNSTYVVAGAAARLDHGTLVQRRVLSSHDGQDWSEAPPLENSLLVEGQPVRGVAYGAGWFVAVSALDGSSSEISTNGVDWVASASSPGGLGVAYGNGLFVSVGPDPSGFLGPGISVSEDGLNWNRVLFSSVVDDLQSIAFADPGFAVVGDGIALRVFPDGTGSLLEGSGRLYSVASGGGAIVSVGEGGSIFSPSGAACSPTTNALYGVAFGNGEFVAVGAGGTMLSSSNAVNWVLRNSATTNDLYGVSYLNRRFLALGANGTILQSGLPAADFAFGQLQSVGPGIRVFIAGDSGQQITVQTSTNLVTWTDSQVIIRPADGNILLERTPTEHLKFYRAVAP